MTLTDLFDVWSFVRERLSSGDVFRRRPFVVLHVILNLDS